MFEGQGVLIRLERSDSLSPPPLSGHNHEFSQPLF